MADKIPNIKDIIKTIKVPKSGSSTNNHVIISPPMKDDDEKGNTNPTQAAKTISTKLKDKYKTEHTLPPKVNTMTDKKTAVRHVNRRYVPAHSVQRSLQGRALPTAGIQASSTRNEEADLTEISKNLAQRYIKRSTTEHGMANFARRQTSGKEQEYWQRKETNRKKGISRAFNIIDKDSSKNEELEEMKKAESEANFAKHYLNALKNMTPAERSEHKEKIRKNSQGITTTNKIPIHLRNPKGAGGVSEGINEMKTKDSQHFPQGPVDDEIQDPARYGRSMASKSMATLKQDLSYALANRDEPGQSVIPDGPVKDQLLGAPYNKGKDLSVDDLDVINKEIGVKLDA